MNRADKWSAPLLTLFFVLSGAALDLGVFADAAIVGVGVLYIVARSIGKYTGSALSCTISHQPSNVKISGHHLIAPGRRGPGHVRSGGRGHG